MKWPELVPDSVCTIPVKIQFEDGINEDGSPKKAVLFEGYRSWIGYFRRSGDKRRNSN